MRDRLRDVFVKYFSEGTGAVETMMMLFGAFVTVREMSTNPTARATAGVSEMLYGFTVGLPLGNPFWQRVSVVLFPALAVAQLDMLVASEYAAEEAKLSPGDPKAADLRRKTAQCMGGLYSMAMLALVADKGVDYAHKHGRMLRDDLTAILG